MGVRVLDAGHGVASAYCTKLLTDQGADVVVLEPPGGDGLRLWSASSPDTPVPATAPLFRFLHGSKRSATVPEADLAGLIGWADVVVTAPRPDGWDGLVRRMWEDAGRGVQVDISPFGRSGPLAETPSTEFTLQAWSGAISARGAADRPPLQQGGRTGEWLAGAVGALAVGAGLIGGHRLSFEVSALEVMGVGLVTYPTLYREFTGRASVMSRGSDYPSAERCREGWIGLCLFSAQQWADFAVMIGRPELAEDTRLNSMAGRGAHPELARSVIRPWLEAHTDEEIFELGGLFRVPVSYIGNGRTLPQMEHFQARATFVRHPGADFLQPRPPFRMSATPVREAGPAPEAGADTDEVRRHAVGAPTAARTAPASGPSRPLAGITVLDLTAYWAGPAGTHLLCTLGARVIKVESTKRPDGIRYATPAPASQPDWLERSPIFQGTNPGKLGVAIDITRPEGRDLILRLARRCDGVWENFTPRVMDNLGLGYAELCAANRELIMVRVPAFGLDGPWRDHSGFAQTMEQVSGMGWLTGYPDGNPLVRTTCDPAAGIHAAFAFLAALRHRRHTGQGQLIEMAMADMAVNLTAEQVIEYSAFGQLMERQANRGPEAAPQGVYACLGDEQWLALAVVSDEQWERLVSAMGHPAWTRDTGLATRAGRRARADEVDRGLAAWSAGQDRDTLVAQLTGAGIPAAPVWNQTLIDGQPQYRARGFFQAIEHPSIGPVDYPGVGFTSPQLDTSYPGPAPMLGQHTRQVLQADAGC
ncbi:MAG TPA: CoA transferase, partial [Acidimicrobiales bacterium]|nr:CoA transferase [Acidimicrobiales bacterium]